MASSTTTRLIHFSDVHVGISHPGWAIGDFLTKRVTGWLNLHALGRAARFKHCNEILEALRKEIACRSPDCLVFSGDATALGFTSEMILAAKLLGLEAMEQYPGVAVPGNHDYYIHSAARSGAFENYFASWQVGCRLPGQTYPFARRIGPLWLIGLNSAVPHHWPTNASGFVDSSQLERLESLADSLEPGIRVLVTHYPASSPGGGSEKKHHGLRNRDRVVNAARRAGISLWLHGHNHQTYHYPAVEPRPFPVVCAGSTTDARYMSYNEYEIEGTCLRCVKRCYSLDEGVFRDSQYFQLDLKA